MILSFFHENLLNKVAKHIGNHHISLYLAIKSIHKLPLDWEVFFITITQMFHMTCFLYVLHQAIAFNGRFKILNIIESCFISSFSLFDKDS